MNTTWKRLSNESEKSYIYRICDNKDAIGTWPDVANILNSELNHDWTESAYRKQYQMGKRYLEECQDELFENETYVEKIRQEREELQRERYKLQAVKLEYNRWLREHARDELFEENVVNCIREVLGTVQPPAVIPVKRNDAERCGILCIADSHYGKDVIVKGLNGEIINQYNPEIFEDRMEQLLSEVVEFCKKENLYNIKVFNLGDSIDGLLRQSQIWNLRFGAVQSAIRYGDYMSRWLRTLSQYTAVEYHPVLIANHSELRLLDGKKDQHLNESAEMVVNKIIEVANENNPNLKIITNETGYIYTEAAGYKIFGIHGEFKDTSTILKDYQEIYNTRIDYLIHGHKHTQNYAEVGTRKGVIGIGSLCGIDDFSIKIRKSSDATASFIVFEKNKGKVDEHTFVLN